MLTVPVRRAMTVAAVFAALTLLLLAPRAHAASSVATASSSSPVALIPSLSWSLVDAYKLAAPLESIPVAPGSEPFSTALRVQVLREAQNTYDIQLLGLTTAQIAKGDACLFTYYVRSEAPPTYAGAAGVTEAMFEGTAAPYKNSLEAPRFFTGQWQKITQPFIARFDYAPGQAKLNFRMGFAPQTVDFADLTLVDYGQGKTLADLPPATPVTYAGREPNAPWRKAALARIEKIRKADLVVRVVDEHGRPVPDATVKATLTLRAFRFGNDVSDQSISGPKSQSADSARWRKEFLAHFDSGTLGLLTWYCWEDPRLHAFDIASAQFLKQNGYEDIHGAHLVWTGWNRVPASVKDSYDATAETDPSRARSELQAAVLAHIRDIVPKMRGIVTTWNVINEETNVHELGDAAGGIPAMAEWFKLAHQLDPDARLIINDYDIVAAGGADIEKQDSYFNLIKSLIADGAPVQGIGFQCHFNALLTSPERALAVLDHFATLGVPLYITEFDTRLHDPVLQGDFTRDFLIAVYSHPAVAGFTMWDFWDGNAWLGNGPLYYKDWSLKPSGKAFLDLADGAWRTSPTFTTNAHGIATARAVLGEYTLTAGTKDGRQGTAHVTLAAGKSTITLTVR